MENRPVKIEMPSCFLKENYKKNVDIYYIFLKHIIFFKCTYTHAQVLCAFVRRKCQIKKAFTVAVM